MQDAQAQIPARRLRSWRTTPSPSP